MRSGIVSQPRSRGVDPGVEADRMTRRLKRIAPLQLGKMLGILYAMMGLLFLPLFALAGLAGAFAQQSTNNGAGALPAVALLVMGFLMPIMYGVMGFLIGIISAAVYNLAARWIGGIEVEVE